MLGLEVECAPRMGGRRTANVLMFAKAGIPCRRRHPSGEAGGCVGLTLIFRHLFDSVPCMC